MKWRKLNRAIHRDLGYFFTAMSIIYGLSGIALNHIDDWNPSYVVTRQQVQIDLPAAKDKITDQLILEQLEPLGLASDYKKHYFPQSDQLRIFIEGGNITLDLASGQGAMESIRRRPVFHQVNFLHYNRPKQLYTWFSDLYAAALIVLAVSGLFILRGKLGITGRGAWLTIAGLLVPLIFLFIYL